MGDLNQFASNMNRLAARVAKNAPKVTRSVAGRITTQLGLGTPVATGKAVSNWQVGIEFPKTSEREAFSEDTLGLGRTEGANRSAMLAESRAAIKGYRQEEGSLFISNNVDYILDLERGKSAKANPRSS
jgi:hypothetical protein